MLWLLLYDYYSRFSVDTCTVHVRSTWLCRVTRSNHSPVQHRAPYSKPTSSSTRRSLTHRHNESWTLPYTDYILTEVDAFTNIIDTTEISRPFTHKICGGYNSSPTSNGLQCLRPSTFPALRRTTTYSKNLPQVLNVRQEKGLRGP